MARKKSNHPPVPDRDFLYDFVQSCIDVTGEHPSSIDTESQIRQDIKTKLHQKLLTAWISRYGSEAWWEKWESEVSSEMDFNYRPVEERVRMLTHPIFEPLLQTSSDMERYLKRVKSLVMLSISAQQKEDIYHQVTMIWEQKQLSQTLDEHQEAHPSSLKKGLPKNRL